MQARGANYEPKELQFQEKYGKIVQYQWYGDGYMMLGFGNGFLVAVSTHEDEVGAEIFSQRVHAESMAAIAVSDKLQWVAAAGDRSVRVLDMMDDFAEIPSLAVTLEADERPARIEWSSDGHVLSISTHAGAVHSYLLKLPTLATAWQSKVLVLSSLRQLSVVDTNSEKEPTLIPLASEPSFVALGPGCAAAGMNNRAWFYSTKPGSTSLLAEREYHGSVQELQLAMPKRELFYAAVLCEGKVLLHAVDPEARVPEGQDQKMFPEQRGSNDATCLDTTADMLVYATSRGTLHFFFIKRWGEVNEYRHEIGIRKVFANRRATRCVFIDDANRAYIYNPVNDEALLLPDCPSGCTSILWDTSSSDVLVAATPTSLATYNYAPVSLSGATVSKVALTSIKSGCIAVTSANGYVTCQASSGSLQSALLASHDKIATLQKYQAKGQERSAPPEVLSGAFEQCLCLNRLPECWDLLVSLHAPHTNMMLYKVLELGLQACIVSGTSGEKGNEITFASKSTGEDGKRQARSLPLSKDWGEAEWSRASPTQQVVVETWRSLAQVAMTTLDIDIAIRCFRQLGDGATVLGLLQAQEEEDLKLLSGHVSLLLGDYGAAQDYFISSSQPVAALQMRRDLLHWDMALKLAKQLDPSQLPFISREYAQQLEFRSNYASALPLYERAIVDERQPVPPTESFSALDHNALANAGVARMTLRLGDIPAGMQLASKLNDKQLFKDCALILEGMKQLQDAAMLFAKAAMHEKAAAIYIASKNFTQAGPLMARITTPKLHLAYAKAKEDEKAYIEAAAAYEKGRDMDAVVRLQLTELSNPHKAFAVVRETRSSIGAAMIAEFCKKEGQVAASIEFLLMSNKNEEAFDLASAHEEMMNFARFLGEGGTPEEYARVARYFESKGDAMQAGKYYSKCTQYHKALKIYLSEPDKCLDAAIDVVGVAQSEMLTNTLIDFLIGEVDGIPKDPRYIFKLYLALGNFTEAVQTAIIIARQEQERGQYKKAHAVLFDTYKDLQGQRISVPRELMKNLCLLHSYILVPQMIKSGDHLSAARMLCRVANSITRFPAHIVPILTSAVKECAQCGLKKSAFEHASVLVRPEYRKSIDDKYKRKIESMVRKRDPNAQELAEPISPCANCGHSHPETNLECPKCFFASPFCIVTGKHLLKTDFTTCPSCRFPAMFSAFVDHVAKNKSCPMCNQEIVASAIQKIDDPSAYLKAYKEQMEPSKGNEEED